MTGDYYGEAEIHCASTRDERERSFALAEVVYPWRSIARSGHARQALGETARGRDRAIAARRQRPFWADWRYFVQDAQSSLRAEHRHQGESLVIYIIEG